MKELGQAQEDAPESSAAPAGGLFLGGLAAYVLGFFLLAHDHPDGAPFVIIAGVLLMMWAFLT